MSAAAPVSSPPAAPAAGIDVRGLAELLLLGAIWGGSFLLMRIAAPAFGAVPLVELRLLFGTVVLLPFAWMARHRLRPFLGRLAIIGLLNSAVPFVLFAWAAARAPAAIGAIANSLTALFAVLVAWLMFGERIGLRRGIGLVAGLAGVVVLVAGRDAGLGSAWAAVAGTVAALCYAVAANLVKRWLVGLPPTATAAATLAFSTVLLAPLAVAQWPATAPGGLAWLCAVALGVLCTGLAYALYFRLLDRVGPSRAATVTYLVPLFGVAWAWALLDEPLTATMAVAGLLILGGVALNQFRPAPRGRA
ncbi:MAG: DMT family transporter [Pseudoxanthomonas sp.]|nr:DMT family transporter [Pseudoxanthomonas sp.]